jgi:Uma2 family endonuclease
MVNLAYDYLHLPTAEELPDSDDTPVDNQLQNDIPNFLLSILYMIWADREDWFFGVDMGIYYDPITKESIVPDGFLALGVELNKSEGGRLSYVLWEENYEIPKLALEVVSKTPNGEYDEKFNKYQTLGILYYVVYNPFTGRRGAYKKRQSLEVYKLVSGKYQLLDKQSIYWLPEIGLGIGCERAHSGRWMREWVYWYDEHGDRYLLPQEVAIQEKLARENAEAIALSERIAKEQAEQRQVELEEQLRKYHDRFGEISE